jgi:hypothetical protein
MNAAAPDQAPTASPPPREVKVVSHSMLFYWWPVWVGGFLLAGLTWMDGHRLAIVPGGTTGLEAAEVRGIDGPRDVLVLSHGERLPPQPGARGPKEPSLRIANHSGYGVVFMVLILLVVFVTNVPLRGLASVVTLLTLLLLAVLFAWLGWWDVILDRLFSSRAYLNAFAYLALAVPLFLLWLTIVLFFDRQVYMTFTPGQLQVHQNIGAGEVAYDTVGMVVSKERSGLLRHWVLGFGSGDLTVRTSGANAQVFHMPNVLFIGSKINMIQDMLQEREVVGKR